MRGKPCKTFHHPALEQHINSSRTPISPKTDGVLQHCSIVLVKSLGGRHKIKTKLTELKIHFDKEIGRLCIEA